MHIMLQIDHLFFHQRRTGGLVTWRSGSVMVVYRGTNYEGPVSVPPRMNVEDDAPFVPDVSSPQSPVKIGGDSKRPILERNNLLASRTPENMTEEEAEYHNLLDGLGPRFEDWWGTGVLPVDADLLPPSVPGYKTPFRLLPTGMRSRLTNAEMTNLRKLAKSLPCHFALGNITSLASPTFLMSVITHFFLFNDVPGRNRNHQGLAASIIKLWEKSLLVKIAVKRGIQNTNNKIMAEELKVHSAHHWKMEIIFLIFFFLATLIVECFLFVHLNGIALLDCWDAMSCLLCV